MTVERASRMENKLNEGLRLEMVSIRKKSLVKRKNHIKVKSWIEDFPLISGEIGKAIVFILPTRGCYLALSKLGGCSMCSYLFDNPAKPDPSILFSEFKRVLDERMEEINSNTVQTKLSVKIYTSGSVLDPAEVPIPALEQILKYLEGLQMVEEVTLETLPRFVTERNIKRIVEWIEPRKVELAIGLETANDDIRTNSVNKGFTWEEFKKAVETAHNYNLHVKAYVLVKPPYLTEQKAITDAKHSAASAIELGIKTISFNLTNVPNHSLVEKLYRRGEFRTPWLWSGVEVVKSIMKKHPTTRVICKPVAAGNKRGAHNCGKCDEEVAERLHECTLNQNIEYLKEIENLCECFNEFRIFKAVDSLAGTGGTIKKNFNFSPYLPISYSYG